MNQSPNTDQYNHNLQEIVRAIVYYPVKVVAKQSWQNLLKVRKVLCCSLQSLKQTFRGCHCRHRRWFYRRQSCGVLVIPWTNSWQHISRDHIQCTKIRNQYQSSRWRTIWIVFCRAIATAIMGSLLIRVFYKCTKLALLPTLYSHIFAVYSFICNIWC